MYHQAHISGNHQAAKVIAIHTERKSKSKTPGMVQGGRREVGSGWGTCVYLWQIHVDVWQNQYNIVKLKKKDYPFRIQTYCHHGNNTEVG